jgi:hypothetical protein
MNTDDERALLLQVARWVAAQEEEIAGRSRMTSNWAMEIRRLIARIGDNRRHNA